jgi:hypothetical protein
MLKNLNTKILASIFLLLCVVIVAVVFTTPTFNKIAQALSSNYSKSATGQLSAADWNNLPNDFVAKSGDTMTGPLTLGGPLTLPSDPTLDLQAATKRYVDNAGIKDVSGNQLKIVCGESNPGSWRNYTDLPGGTPDAIFTDVDTRVGGVAAFTTAPMYFTSLLCLSGCWRAMGGQSVYNGSPTGFRVFIQDFNPEVMDRILAQTWNYRIRWCGIGQ